VSNQKIAPCPLCGDEPGVQALGSCVEIWCRVGISLQKSDYLTARQKDTWDNEALLHDTESEAVVLDQAVLQWNTRPAEIDLKSEIERLKTRLIAAEGLILLVSNEELHVEKVSEIEKYLMEYDTRETST
jgi:hypothetical protein